MTEYVSGRIRTDRNPEGSMTASSTSMMGMPTRTGLLAGWETRIRVGLEESWGILRPWRRVARASKTLIAKNAKNYRKGRYEEPPVFSAIFAVKFFLAGMIYDRDLGGLGSWQRRFSTATGSPLKSGRRLLPR
jgi:hypothetical protein